MAFVFNIAKGRVAEFYNRVQTNDPANSALLIVPIFRGSTPNSTLEDKETLADLLTVATERTTGGWSRLVLTDADLAAFAADHTNNRVRLSLVAKTWPEVLVGSGAITDLVVCYDADTTAGTDANIVPLTCHVYPVTPNGAAVNLLASDLFEAV